MRDNEKLADFARTMYRANEGYDAFLQIHRKKANGSWQLVRCVHSSELPTFFEREFYYVGSSEYFISHNGYKTHKNDEENLFTLYNIVIDIDAHGDLNETARTKLIDKAAWLAMENVADAGLPNIIVRTGRGLQIWYAIEPVPAGAAWKYRIAAKYICDAYKKVLDEEGLTNQGLNVDEAVSCSPSGVRRLPGSYNADRCKDGTFTLGHQGRLDLDAYVEAVAAESTGSKKYSNYARCDAAGLAQRRAQALLDLIDIRGGFCNGYRDKFCFILYCIWGNVLADHEEIMEHVRGMNDKFSTPIEERKLAGYMVSANRKRYRLKDTTVIAWLDITPEEQDAIGLHPKSERETEREERREAKKERNANILYMHQAGILNRDIAVAVGCSPQTVGRVIDRQAGVSFKEERNSRIWSLHKDGLKNKDIAAAVGCSLQTVGRVIAKQAA